jgi:hypothetical protein
LCHRCLHHQLELELNNRSSQSLRATTAHIQLSEPHLLRLSRLLQHARQAQCLQLEYVKTQYIRPLVDTTASNATMQQSLEQSASTVPESKTSTHALATVSTFRLIAIWPFTTLRVPIAILHKLRPPLLLQLSQPGVLVFK